MYELCRLMQPSEVCMYNGHENTVGKLDRAMKKYEWYKYGSQVLEPSDG